ncbi:MAG: winged helix-turn-helix transcriptional regulator [Actinomycetota bacterium]
MKTSPRASFCPHFRKAIELVGKRWSGTILRALMDGPSRFSEICAHVPDISDRSLSMRLKELEREGLVIRRVDPTQPVSVSYELTDKGRALERAIAEVERWAHDWVAPHAEVSDDAVSPEAQAESA